MLLNNNRKKDFKSIIMILETNFSTVIFEISYKVEI